MQITEIQVEKFRNLSDIDITFAKRINAIAGQNGTSKTSILGLIGHIFSYPKSYKTLSGKFFSTEFSEIFRFAYPDYDKAGEHLWRTKIEGREGIPAMSFDRKESGKDSTIRIRVGKSSKGSGKIQLPVIYLGMGRLFPLSLEKEIKGHKSALSDDEIKEYRELHNEILLIDEDITPESISTSSKNFYAPKTDKYNHLGNSAGQDNIGQIITALISFKRLRKEIGEKYKGGILLIDELDASLYPAAQIKLVQKLEHKSKELNLQIFFTTHSLEVLSEVQKKSESKVIFLDKSHGKIKPRYDLDFTELKENLLVLGPDSLKKVDSKRFVYCEDDEAKDMLKNILNKDNLSRIEIFPTKLGGGVLKEIAKKKIPDFKKSLIILDGDTSDGGIDNVTCLPYSSGPDRLAYDFLKSLDASHEFWKKKKGYDKQFCFKNLNSLDSSLDQARLRDKLKKWYGEQSKYWGRNSCDFWKVWAQNNQVVVDEFNLKLSSLI